MFHTLLRLSGMLLSCFFLAFSAQGQNNISCETATALNLGDHSVFIDSLTVSEVPTEACFGANAPSTKAVVYQITGNDQMWTINTCNSGFDTKVNIYRGSCDELVCVGGFDDQCGTRAIANFFAEGDSTYYLFIGGASAADYGELQMSVSHQALASNHRCDVARTATVNAFGDCEGNTSSGNFFRADADTLDFCNDGFVSDLWYVFNSQGRDSLLLNIDKPVGMSLHAELFDACGTSSAIAGNCFVLAEQSERLLTGLGNVSRNYWLRLSLLDYEASKGSIAMCLSELPSLSTNTSCAARTALTCGLQIVANNYGVGDQLVNSDCDSAQTVHGGLWFELVGNGNLMTVSACGSSIDTRMQIFTGSCGELVCLAENDDSPLCNSLSSELTINTDLDSTYYILISGYDASERGLIQLEVYCCRPPIEAVADFEIFIDANNNDLDTTFAATVSWTSGNIGAEYIVEFGEAGFNDGEGDIFTGSVDSINMTLSGFPMDSHLIYEFTVREVCGFDTTERIRSAQFGDGIISGLKPILAPVVQVYPNPSSGLFQVQIDNHRPYDLHVYNMMGAQILQQNARATTSFDLSDYPKGLYFVEIVQNNLRSRAKIVLQ